MSLSIRSVVLASILSLTLVVLFLPSCGEECVPSCQGIACGNDGCGGSCGICEEGAVCYYGACVPACEGELNYCDGYCVDLFEDRNHCGRCDRACPMGQYCEDGNCVATACTPNCSGRECGDDGCGQSCGSCEAGEVCQTGTCVVSTCTPNCSGKECGDDSCGAVCGVCDTGQSCVAGACLADQPGDSVVLVAWESSCEPGSSAPPSQANASNAGSRLTAYGVRETALNHEYHSFICVSNAFSSKHWNNDDFDEKYWMVKISTAGHEEIRVSSRQSGSNTGPRDFVLQYGTEGDQWTDTGVSITVGADWETGVVNRHLLPAAVDDSPEVYIRWRLGGQASINGGEIGTTGAGRIDGIVVEGRGI